MRAFWLAVRAVLLALVCIVLSASAIIFAQTPPAAQQAVLPQKPAPPNAGGSAAPGGGAIDDIERADLFMVRKEYAEAASVYLQLLKTQPNNAILLNKLGIAYHQLTMLDRAKHCYERATKADHNYASAYNNIGTVHYQRRNYSKAINAYRKALQIAPDSPAFYSNLGYAYFGKKDYEHAMIAFHRALELDPQVFERSHGTGTTLQDRSVDDHGLFYFFLAKSFAEMGNAERCAHYLRKALDEGYKGVPSVESDPAFARVVGDPEVQKVLRMAAPTESQAVTPPGPGS